ncbi:energy transducer TonB, partial [Sphingomonas bacterium]|uniref:energy transducer TonB n=1 Tax=Sphingomonas bacterium TaxID=1895847 RepID=UPI001575804A
PNKRSKATPVVAPPPIVPPIQPAPVIAAIKPAIGVNATSGAAPVAGPGTGAGGQGNGTGSGRGGNGDGDGGTPLRRIGGELRARDIPQPIVRQLLATGVNHYVVSLRFTVGIAGRVTDCTVSRTSGSTALDGETCRLIIDKLRYRPELDGAGRPIPVVVVGTQEWTIGGTPPSGREVDDDE